MLCHFFVQWEKISSIGLNVGGVCVRETQVFFSFFLKQKCSLYGQWAALVVPLALQTHRHSWLGITECVCACVRVCILSLLWQIHCQCSVRRMREHRKLSSKRNWEESSQCLLYDCCLLCDAQAEMVSNALQTQRRFLKMVTTHQEPAQVRHAGIHSYFFLSRDWRLSGLNVAFLLFVSPESHTLFHWVIFPTLPVAKAETGIHACSFSFQPSSCCGATTSCRLFLSQSLLRLFTDLFSDFPRKMEKTSASWPASWLGFVH